MVDRKCMKKILEVDSISGISQGDGRLVVDEKGITGQKRTRDAILYRWTYEKNTKGEIESRWASCVSQSLRHTLRLHQRYRDGGMPNANLRVTIVRVSGAGVCLGADKWTLPPDELRLAGIQEHSLPWCVPVAGGSWRRSSRFARPIPRGCLEDDGTVSLVLWP